MRAVMHRLWATLLLVASIAACAVPSTGSDSEAVDSVTSLVAVEVLRGQDSAPPAVHVPANWMASGISVRADGYDLQLHRPLANGYELILVCIGKNPVKFHLTCQMAEKPAPIGAGWLAAVAHGETAVNLEFTDDFESLREGILMYSKVTAF